jgi:hypothetical protein
MKGSTVESSVAIIRVVARLWSIASLAFMLLMVAGEVFSPHAPAPESLRDVVGLLLFPFGVCVGIILAWRWEGLGGGIAGGSLLAFYAAMRVMDGRFPRGPFFALVGAPGFLFLVCWALHLATDRPVLRHHG